MASVTLTCPSCGFSKCVSTKDVPPVPAKVTCPKCKEVFLFQGPPYGGMDVRTYDEVDPICQDLQHGSLSVQEVRFLTGPFPSKLKELANTIYANNNKKFKALSNKRLMLFSFLAMFTPILVFIIWLLALVAISLVTEYDPQWLEMHLKNNFYNFIYIAGSVISFFMTFMVLDYHNKTNNKTLSFYNKFGLHILNIAAAVVSIYLLVKTSNYIFTTKHQNDTTLMFGFVIIFTVFFVSSLLVSKITDYYVLKAKELTVGNVGINVFK